MTGYLEQYWRGAVSPFFSAFVVLLFGRIAIFFGYGFLPARLPFGGPALLYGLDASVLIWQTIGALRSSRRSNLGIQIWPIYFAIGFGVFLYVYASVGFAFRDVVANEIPDPPQIVFIVNNQTVFIEGELDFDRFEALDKLLAAQGHGITTVNLQSNGGLVHAARGLARLILENHLDTRVTTFCNSACTLVFMAGEQRELGKNARIGFHSYAEQGIAVNDILKEQNRDRNYFLNRGVAPEFVDQVFTAPPDQMWFPDLQTLARNGVSTQATLH